MNILEYMNANYLQILALLIEHVKLTTIAVGLALAIGVPLGILISYINPASKPVLSVANVIQAIPSMALLGFMIPFLGIGSLPAVAAVVLYSLLPIIKNTHTGIKTINPQTLEAAKGIGLTPVQILMKIQIPLALPVIMTGVRVAAVTAVGLMTMAAFIGAGGLGFLVFSGIRTVNNNQILAGAIPACLLALTVDFLFGLVEKLVTPISLQKGERQQLQKQRRVQKQLLYGMLAVVVLIFGLTTQNRASANTRVITIGSKDFTEQAVLGNLVADLIAYNTDIQVQRKLDLGGTKVIFSALQKGDIDLYMEYSGTAYSDTLKYPPINDMNEVYSTVKKEFKEKYDIEVLPYSNFNNTYVMAVTQEMAERYQLQRVSDLKRVAHQMKSGTTFEFWNRADGLPGLEKTYGFQFQENLAMDGAPRYTALIHGEVDVVDAFATDGLLKKLGLKALEDDMHFFPPYNAMPIVRAEVLAQYPEIVPLLTTLGDMLTDEIMIELNYQVDELQLAPQQVARTFLQEQGLIP